jgi:hypothetical protein
LLLPSRPFPVSGWVPRVFPCAGRENHRETVRRAPHDLGLTFRAPTGVRRASSAVARCVCSRLSWDSLELCELVALPPTDSGCPETPGVWPSSRPRGSDCRLLAGPPVRSLPVTSPPPSANEGPPRQSRSVLVVLLHLDGFPRTGVAGLLHPAAGKGSPRLRSSASACRAAPLPMPARLRKVRRLLATHLTPLEEVPPPAARCDPVSARMSGGWPSLWPGVSAGPCPLAVAPPRCPLL